MAAGTTDILSRPWMGMSITTVRRMSGFRANYTLILGRMMPSNYKFYCEECRWKGSRYRNLKICPRCGAPVHKEIDRVICYHGTDEVAMKNILQVGFKPDSWLARHMEDALAVGGNIIIAVQFEGKHLPQSWQFHILEAIPVSSIRGIYEVKEVPDFRKSNG